MAGVVGAGAHRFMASVYVSSSSTFCLRAPRGVRLRGTLNSPLSPATTTCPPTALATCRSVSFRTVPATDVSIPDSHKHTQHTPCAVSVLLSSGQKVRHRTSRVSSSLRGMGLQNSIAAFFEGPNGEANKKLMTNLVIFGGACLVLHHW